MTKVVEEIAVKTASLPAELQHEVLDFVDFVAGKSRPGKTVGRPFKSVRGIIDRDLPNLEEDLTEMRKEMWGNFPREGAK